MYLMPFQILAIWFRILLALALIGVGIYLLYEWYQNRVTWEPVQVVERAEPRPPAAELPPPHHGEADPQTGVEYRPVSWQFGWNWPTFCLLAGLGMLLWSAGGGWSYPWLFRRSTDGKSPQPLQDVKTYQLRRPDGTALHVSACGAKDRPVLVFTHGWSLNSNEWYYAKNELAKSYRLVFWDLPGLGATDARKDLDFGLDKMAQDLDLVVNSVNGHPVYLLGHSIGGMIILTYCRLFRERLGSTITGLILVHSTYTNPVKTTRSCGLMTALQMPVLEPLCRLMILFSPVVRAMNWLSYLNGSAHRSTERSSFSGRESRRQLDFITREFCKGTPSHVARGFQAMFRYDATDVLPTIPVPTLVVAADRDTTCTPEASAFMAQSIPQARLVSLVDAKHCGLFEHHQKFHTAVSEFVDATQSAPVRTDINLVRVPIRGGEQARPE